MRYCSAWHREGVGTQLPEPRRDAKKAKKSTKGTVKRASKDLAPRDSSGPRCSRISRRAPGLEAGRSWRSSSGLAS